MNNREVNNELEFRKIPSLKFLYEISEDGRIFRNVKSKRQIKLWRNNQDYWMAMCSISGKHFYKTVHSVIAECWLGENPAGFEIDHIDGNKSNNHYSNLRYVTHSQNNLKHPVILRNYEEILKFDSQKECVNFLAEKYGRNKGTVQGHLSKRRKHIYDYDVEYLPIIYETVETARVRSTEQETVQF